MWAEKYLACAKKKGFKDVLMEKAVTSKDDAELEDEANDSADVKKNKKKLREMKEMNELAYDDLIMSMDGTKSGGKVAFNIIKNTKTEEYPDGNASIAWQKLKKKYAPMSAPNLLKVYREFYGAKYKKHWDLEVFITNMEDLRSKMENMGHKMEDKQFMIHILNVLPKAYKTQVGALEKSLVRRN